MLRKLFDLLTAKDKTNPEPESKSDSSSDAVNVPLQETDLFKSLKEHVRTAYIPVVQSSANRHNSDSKIGGLPYLTKNNEWPICPNCKKHMTFFLQINRNEIPVNKSNHLTQMFYCINTDASCEVELQAFFPFSKATVCRNILIENESIIIQNPNCEIFPEKRIIGWTAMDDYPSQEEYENLGITQSIDDELYDEMHEQNIGIPLTGDKLYGWPSWVQSDEYPNDRVTGRKMEFFFQLDSMKNIPHMFGDYGTGHITQSEDNFDEITFAWACS